VKGIITGMLSGLLNWMANRVTQASSETIVAGAIPLTVVMFCYFHIAVVRVTVGRLPDPGHLPQPLYTSNAIAALSIAMLYPLSYAALVYFALSFFKRFRHFRNGSTAFLLGQAVMIAFLVVDPGGWLHWVMD